MFTISKEFSFCYGHRVWVQQLNTDYCASGDTNTKCRHNHGHEGRVLVHLSASDLDNRSMVVDFKELGWLKDFIDKNLDHKFVIDRNDPMFAKMVVDLYAAAPKYSADDRSISDPVEFISKYTKDIYSCVGKNIASSWYTGNIVNCNNVIIGTPEYEVLEGFFIVNFPPTSEQLCRWLYSIVFAAMAPLGITVTAVEWHETPKSCAVYKPSMQI